MKRKIFVMIIAFLGMCSVGYAQNNDLFANASTTYNTGGSVTGRVNMAPTGISGSNIGFQKGDKIASGLHYNGSDVTWQLLSEETYSDYGCVTDSPCSNPSQTAWLSGTVNSIAQSVMANSASEYDSYCTTAAGCNPASSGILFVLYSNSPIFSEMEQFNIALKSSKFASQILKERNLTFDHKLISSSSSSTNTSIVSQLLAGYDNSSRVQGWGKNSFIMARYAVSGWNGASYGGGETIASPYASKDLMINQEYHVGGGVFNNPSTKSRYSNNLIDTNGLIKVYTHRGTNNSEVLVNEEPWGTNHAIRPYAYLGMDDVVFAVSQGTNAKLGKVTEPNLPTDYTNIYNDATGSEMKARLLNSSMNVSFIDMQNSSNLSISKITKNTSVNIIANANSGNDSSGNPYTLSALLFDETGKFKYYLPIETITSETSYSLDITGVPVGKYQVALVNEAYSSGMFLADSSALSDVINLEIVSPLSNLTFTPTSSLKYNSNVNTSDTIGTITSQNGAGTPVYTLVADPSNIGDVAKFKIGSDGISIQVKGNTLDAGTYKFKIQAQDANGHPHIPLEISETIITVSKGTITSIAFDDTNKTKKSMKDAQTEWNELATSELTSSDLKITYSKKSGDIGIITLDSDSGEVKATSANAKGNVVIQATVDDNPDTGKDNYETLSTTKEIMIFQEVNGHVTPDPKSSDSNNPTFKAMDDNIKEGGKIGTIAGSEGTQDNGTSGATTYTYGLKNEGDASFFDVNTSTGVIISKVNLSVETYEIIVTVSDKWSTKEIPVTINVGQSSAEALKFYDPKNTNTIITTQSAGLDDKGITVFAEVKGSKNANTVKYGRKDGASTSVVDVHETSGVITIKSVGTTTITATKQGDVGQANAYAEITFTVTAGAQNFTYVDSAGNELAKNDDGSYQSYKESGKEVVYQKDKTFQLFTEGAPEGAEIKYKRKLGSPTYTVDVDENGLVSVWNATLPEHTDKVIIQAISTDPNGNYEDKTIEIAINISKADSTISFNGVSNVVSGTGSVEPLINDQDISSKAGGVEISDTQYIIVVDPSISSDIAWTNDGKSIQYEYSETTGIDIPLKVTKPANRNYNKAEATGTMRILSPEENILEVSTPGKITYGETFTIRSLQDDSSSTNVVYTFTSNDTSTIKVKEQTGNQMNFEAIKASGTNEIEIKIDRSADGELPLSKKIKVKVLPKEITIKVDNKEKLYGEVNPVFTYQDFTSRLVSWNGVMDTIQTSDIKLTSRATVTSIAGSYDVEVDTAHLNKTYPNYNFKFTKGNLLISEDTMQDDWYHMETTDTNAYTGTWTNQDVKILSDHVDYTEISANKQVWQDELVVSMEGKTKQLFYMKKASGAISSSKEASILIDKEPPKITSIKGNEVTKSRVQEFLNALTFKAFFKPGGSIEIKAEDVKATQEIEISEVKSIAYKLYEIGNDVAIESNTGNAVNGTLNFTIQNPGNYKVCAITTDHAGNQSVEVCEEIEVKKIDVDVDKDGDNDFLDPDGDGCPDINIAWINEDKTWTKLNVDQNGDDIPDMNIDSNGDGIADLNIDTDGDKRPDLNLVILKKEDWKPTICVTTQPEEYCTGTTVKARINVDIHAGTIGRTKDNIPDINIDTTGDMKADINITKPNEEKPFINITSKHSIWKPEKDFTFEKFSYDTDATMKAILNVDSDKDGKPDLNIDFNGDNKPDLNIDANGDGIPETDIDSDGDGEPDVNVDTNKDGKPDENIIEIKVWKPDTDGLKEGFAFDTMTGINGKDKLEDNDVTVEKPGGVFLPNYALKVDRVTDSANELLKKDIINKANGQVIKEIYDVKLLEDEVQIQPDGKLKIRLPMPEGIINPRLVIQLADGTYFKVKPEIKDGYLIYESDYLGLVSIIGDHEEVVLPDEDVNVPDAGGAVDNDTSTSVKGAYTAGTNTGDDTNIFTYGIIMVVGVIIIITIRKRYRKDTN